MSCRIFISYRRSDTQGWAGHLGDGLRQAFGVEPLFFDLESIQPGDDFVDAIENGIAAATVVVALIGPAWLTATLPDGGRRLDDANDFVRLELRTALARQVPVIPLLVGGAAMPKAGELPSDVAGLARRQALELSDSRWDYDVGQLAKAIERAGGCERRAAAPLSHASGAAVSVAAGAIFENVEAGDVAGVKAAAALPQDAPDRPIDVLRGATVKNTKLQDIAGIKIDRGRTDGQ